MAETQEMSKRTKIVLSTIGLFVVFVFVIPHATSNELLFNIVKAALAGFFVGSGLASMFERDKGIGKISKGLLIVLTIFFLVIAVPMVYLMLSFK